MFKGKRFIVNDSIGEVIILDIQDNYVILFRIEIGQFVKANKYHYDNNKLSWEHGEYYNNLTDLVGVLEID